MFSNKVNFGIILEPQINHALRMVIDMYKSSRLRFTLKAVVIGDGMVGKTSLCNRFLKKGFTREYKRTIGADYYMYDQHLTLNEIGVSVQVKWILCDLAGQFAYYEVRPLFYYGAKAALVVFDISRPDTFRSIPAWIYEFWKYASKDELSKRPIVIVGNKSDLRDKVENTVPREIALNYAKKISKSLGFEVPYIETSALLGHGVDDAFEKLLLIVIRHYGILNKLKGALH